MNETLDILVRVRGNVSEGVNALRSFIGSLGQVGAALNSATGSIGTMGSAFATGLMAPARSAASVLRETFLTAQQSASSFLQTLTGAGQAFFYIRSLGEGLAGLGQGFLGANIQLESFLTRYQALLKSAEAAQARVRELQLLNVESPFELPDLIAADMALQSSGKRTIELVRDVANAASALGGTSFQLTEIAQAVSRIGGGNFGEGFERLRELNVATTAELKGEGLKFDSNNSYKGSIEDALTAIQTIIREKFGDAAALASQTWTGIVSNISDRIGQLRLIVGQPVFDTLKVQLQGVLTYLNDPRWETIAGFIGIGLNNAIQAVISAISHLTSLIGSGLSSAFNAINTSTGGLIQTLGAVLAAVAPLGRAIIAVFQGDFATAFAQIRQFLSNITVTLLNGFATLGADLFKGGVNVISSFAGGLIEGAGVFVQRALNYITNLIASFLRGFSPPKEGPLSTIDTWFPNVIDAYLGSWREADWGLLDDLTSNIADSFQELVTKGAVSVQQAKDIVLGTKNDRGLNELVAQAINEIVTTGQVGVNSWSAIQESLTGVNDALLESLRGQLFNAQLNQEMAQIESVLNRINSSEATKQLKESIDVAKEAIKNARTRNERKAARDTLSLLQQEERKREETVNVLKEQLAYLKEQAAANTAQMRGLDAINKLRERELEFLKDINKEKASGGGGGNADQTDAVAEAAWRYSFAIADNQTKLSMLREKLAGVSEGSVEYYQILTDIAQLESQINKEASDGAEARAKAAWDYSFAIADNETKLGMLRDRLGKVEEGSVEYYQLLGQIRDIEGNVEKERANAANKAAADANARADAEFNYQMKLADTAGKLALLRGKLEGVEEGSVEYYQILGQITDLEKQLAKEAEGRGGASKAAAAESVAATGNIAGAVTDGVDTIKDALGKGQAKWDEFNGKIDEGKQRFVDFKKKAEDALNNIRLSNNPIIRFFGDLANSIREFLNAFDPFIDKFTKLQNLKNAPVAVSGKAADSFKNFLGPDGLSINGEAVKFDMNWDSVADSFKQGLSDALKKADFGSVFASLKTGIQEKVKELGFGKMLEGALLTSGVLLVGPAILTALAGIPVAIAAVLGPFGFLAAPLNALAAPLRLVASLMTRFTGAILSIATVLFNAASAVAGFIAPFIAMTGPIGIAIAIIGALALAIYALNQMGLETVKVIGEFGTKIAKAVIKGLDESIVYVNLYIPRLLQKLGEAVPQILNQMTLWTEALGRFVTLAIPRVGALLRGLVTNILNFVSNNYQNIGNAFGTWAASVGTFVLNAVPLVLDQLAQLVMSIGNWIIEQVPAMIVQFGQWGFTAIRWVIDALPGLVENLKRFLDTMINWILENAPVLVKNLATWAMTFASWLLPQIPTVLGQLGELLLSILSWIAEKAVQIATALLQWGIEFVQWVGQALTQLPEKLAELFGVITQWISDRVSELPALIGAFIPIFLNWVDGATEGLPEKLIHFAGTVIEWVLTTAIELVGTFAEWGISALSWIATTLIELPGNLRKIISAVTDWIIENGPTIASKVKEWAVAFFSWVADVLKDAPDRFASILKAIKEELGKITSGVVEKAKEIGKRIVEAIIEGLGNVGSAIYDATIGPIKGTFQDITDTLGLTDYSKETQPIGVDIAQGIAQGVKDATPTVKAEANTLVTTLKNSMKTSLGIQSPSTVLRDEVGIPIVQGITEGMNAEAPIMHSAFGGLLNPLTTMVNGIREPIVSSFVGTATGMLTQAMPVFSQLQTDASTVFNTLAANIGLSTSNAAAGATTNATTLQTNVLGLANSTSSQVTGIFDTLKTNVVTKVGATSSSIQEQSGLFTTAGANIGRSIVDGMTNGVVEKTRQLAQAAANAANSAVQAAKAALGIQSPSRVFRDEVGNQSMIGMALGITEKQKLIEDSMRQSIGGLPDIANTATTGVIESSTQMSQEALVQYNMLADQALMSIERLRVGIAAFTPTMRTGGLNIAQEFVQGIVSGIQQGMQTILTMVRDMGLSIIDAAKDALGIASPSKVAMEQIGQPFTEGVAIGAQSGFDALSRAILPMKDALLNPLSGIGQQANSLLNGINGQIGQSVGAFAFANRDFNPLQGGGLLPSFQKTINVEIKTFENPASVETVVRRVLEEERQEEMELSNSLLR